MSKVTFAGNMYADRVEKGSGDRNNLANYEITCGCGAFIGFVASYRENADGQRSCLCIMCSHMTIVRGTTVENVTPYTPRDEDERKKIQELREEAVRLMGEKSAEEAKFLKQIRAQ